MSKDVRPKPIRKNYNLDIYNQKCNNQIKKELIAYYGNKCWMGYKVTNKNRLTSHHIKKQAEGGLTIAKNIALISNDAHYDLNIIEKIHPNLFDVWNKFFLEIIQNDGLTPYLRKTQKVLKSYTQVVLDRHYNQKEDGIKLMLQRSEVR